MKIHTSIKCYKKVLCPSTNFEYIYIFFIEYFYIYFILNITLMLNILNFLMIIALWALFGWKAGVKMF